MGNFKKNEKGAALVLTLMIITLFLVFVLSQFYQVTNTTRQVTSIKKNIDAQHIAEMGIEYYYQKIKHAYMEETKDITDIIDQIQYEKVILDKDKNGNATRSFELMTKPEIDPNDPNKINIICKGIAFGKEVIEENEINLVEN